MAERAILVGECGKKTSTDNVTIFRRAPRADVVQMRAQMPSCGLDSDIDGSAILFFQYTPREF